MNNLSSFLITLGRHKMDTSSTKSLVFIFVMKQIKRSYFLPKQILKEVFRKRLIKCTALTICLICYFLAISTQITANHQRSMFGHVNLAKNVSLCRIYSIHGLTCILSKTRRSIIKICMMIIRLLYQKVSQFFIESLLLNHFKRLTWSKEMQCRHWMFYFKWVKI